MRHLKRSSPSPAAQLHCRLGCEHMFPDELKGESNLRSDKEEPLGSTYVSSGPKERVDIHQKMAVEEKLIALNSCYGFITRYSIPDGK